jgi:death on curing protein
VIFRQEAIKIHQILIKRYGGIQGIRDLAMLESALERPYAGLESKEFYPSPEEKASAIIESIVKNHPFYDGNKRTGYVLMRLTLLQNNLDIKASMNDKHQFVIAIASGELDFESILDWIKDRIIEK